MEIAILPLQEGPRMYITPHVFIVASNCKPFLQEQMCLLRKFQGPLTKKDQGLCWEKGAGVVGLRRVSKSEIKRGNNFRIN